VVFVLDHDEEDHVNDPGGKGYQYCKSGNQRHEDGANTVTGHAEEAPQEGNEGDTGRFDKMSQLKRV